MVTFSRFLPLFVEHTSHTSSHNSYENFIETDNMGGRYLSFGTGINDVCKQRAAHPFIELIVPDMHTSNKSRVSRKTVNSDLQEILAPLFDLDSAPGHALSLLELLHHSTITDAIEHSNAAETVTAIAIALKKLEKLNNPSTQLTKAS